MEKEVLDIDEMRLLLLNNMFEEVTEENEDRLENFFTPFQIHLRLKIPVDNREYKMALQMMGLMGFYKGHSIPTDPDVGAFLIKESADGDRYIQVLIPQTKLDDVEQFINEDENFNQYMKKMCEEDAKALFEESDFICLSMLTSSPSPYFGHILTYAATEVESLVSTSRRAHIYIDHDWNEKEVDDYITPYKEGVMSSYERTGIAVPGMPECNDPSSFTKSMDALRLFYKVCNKKNVVVDNPFVIKNFTSKWMERNHVPVENNIDEISKNYISLRRVAKYLFDEYLTLYDLGMKMKYSKFKQLGSIGEAEMLNDILVLLLNNKERLLQEKMERDM